MRRVPKLSVGLFRKAKGYRGGRNNLLRTVKETVIRAEAYAFRDRRVRKRDFSPFVDRAN